MPAPSRVGAPLLPSLLAVATMLPEGLNIRPGGVLLTMPRLVLLAAAPVILGKLLQPAAGSGFRFARCDRIVLLTALWMFLSVAMTQGLARAAIGSSVMILELCGGYFLIRTSLTRPGQAVALARLLATVIAIDGALSVLDVIAKRPVLLDLADALTGFDQAWQEDYRHGMMRALGMQEHPIMLGIVSVFGFVLATFVLRGVRRAATMLGCVIGLVTSDSSAPILAFMIFFVLLAYQAVLSSYPARWKLLLTASLCLFVVFAVIHPNPFGFIVMHTTSVPQDGFYRLLIWNIVGPLVLDSPWVGLGLESDFAVRFGVNNTIDCFWLASAVNFGIVGSALFGLMLLTACDRPIRRRRRGPSQPVQLSETDVRLGRALGIIVFFYFLIGMTVHFWGTVWILLGITAALRAHLGQLSDRAMRRGPAEIDPVRGEREPRAFAGSPEPRPVSILHSGAPAAE